MRVVWTRASFDDRIAIFDYIATDNRRAAIATDNRIKDQARRLKSHPYSGRKGRLNETRELVIAGTPYVALYLVTEDAVRILRVLHGAQRWPQEICLEL